MDGLAEKRVGIIGAGAPPCRSFRRSPRVAQGAYVFQPTPRAVGVHNQRPTDVEWFQEPRTRLAAAAVVNCARTVTGAEPEVDLVADGWTKVMSVDTPEAAESEEEAEALERVRLRGHGGDPTPGRRGRSRSPRRAERLKPYWGKHCKRVCFHDDYLPAFNQPNVHLVDTNGQGVEKLTARQAR